FVQAEDGIRDWSVTGVQTCALPISMYSRPPPTGIVIILPRVTVEPPRRSRVSSADAVALLSKAPCTCDGPSVTAFCGNWRTWMRSEERRVGKECRAGWAAE